MAETYVGLDVHKEYCQATVMDEHGEIIKEGKFENTINGFELFFGSIGDAEVVMEATYSWRPTYERLEEMGYEVKLAHPKKTRAIAEAKIKTDSVDARILAQLLGADLIPEAYIPPKDVRELRDLVRLRTHLVRDGTRLKNRIHAELEKHRIKAKGNIFTVGGKKQLRELGIDSVNHYLAVMDVLDERIKIVSREIRERADESEDAQLLMSIPGVSYFTAMLVLSEIGDVERFPSAEKLCSYFGLVPSVHQSGGKTRLGSITRQGSGLVRWALTQSVWIHVRRDTRLSRYYRRIARRKSKQKAAVATARKLLVVMYWMLKRGEEFRG